jgi:hypothetical protein
MHVPVVDGLQFLPLVHREHAPDGQHHHGVGLLQLGARGHDRVHL